MELLEEHRIDPVTGLVPLPELVAKRLNRVVGGDTQMSDTLLEHRQDRTEHTPDSTDLATVGGNRRGDSVEMSKELVGAVEEEDVHFLARVCAQTVRLRHSLLLDVADVFRTTPFGR